LVSDTSKEKPQSSHKELVKTISQVKELVEKLDLPESLRPEVFGALLTVELLKGVEHRTGEAGSQIRKVLSEEMTLPGRILALREKGFFKDSRTDAEVHTEITKTYPCDLQRVRVALLRLSRKKELRRMTKKKENKEHVAYAW